MITGNIRLKLVALLLATLIWYYVDAADKPIDKLIEVPLIEPAPLTDLAFRTVLPDKVGLYVKGPLSRIMQIVKANEDGILKAKLDMKNAREGKNEYTIRVTGANLRWLEREIIPDKLEIEIEQYDVTTVTPERDVIGGLNPDTSIVLEKGLPGTVEVSGAKSLVNEVYKVVYQLEETDLIGYAQTTVDFIAQDTAGRRIPNVKIDPPSAEIEIGVRKTGSSRQVTVDYDYYGSTPPGYRVASIIINPSFINIFGPPEILRTIDSVTAEPIDLTGHSDDFIIPRALKLEEHADQVTMKPNIVTIEVKINHITISSSFDGLPIQFEGGADESLIYYSSEPRTVTVTVDGPINEINKLTREMITPMINVRGLGEGLHENRPVSIHILNPNISLVEVVPDIVSVTVKKIEFNIGNEGDNE